jgi:tripartite-type tricarboxylate transporter receptor subunit TctC
MRDFDSVALPAKTAGLGILYVPYKGGGPAVLQRDYARWSATIRSLAITPE